MQTCRCARRSLRFRSKLIPGTVVQFHAFHIGADIPLPNAFGFKLLDPVRGPIAVRDGATRTLYGRSSARSTEVPHGLLSG